MKVFTEYLEARYHPNEGADTLPYPDGNLLISPEEVADETKTVT